MSASNKLDQYLANFSQRLKRLTVLQGVAAISLVLLIFATIGAYFSIESGYASSTIITFRVILLLGLAAVTIRFLIQPLQRIKVDISEQVESRALSANASPTNPKDTNSKALPAQNKGFDGRIATYTQMQQSDSPFLELLAEDTLTISRNYPVDQQIHNKELSLAGGLAATAVAILLYLLIAGPNNFNYSLRNFFAGWAIDDLLPPQSIVVTPGDQSIRRGANLRITAAMEGFNPDEASIHVQNGGGEWQEVDLIQSPNGFEFTFFSLQEPMAYYISTTGVRSPEFDIQVVDLPSIEELSLTYHYPEWTERDAETFTQGDIDTLPETRIQLTITTSGPLGEGALVLNSVDQAMSLNGNEATTEFTVLDEGEYFLAAIVGGEQVRLSDDYFIRITEDGKPTIEFLRPGGDYNASNIEEVLTRIEANDDYGLENITLKYAINGKEWQEVNLLSSPSRSIQTEHIFMLENMHTEESREVTTSLGAFNIVLGEELSDPPTLESSNAPAEPTFEIEEIPLQPGDLISYFAEVSDRSQTVRTDMFFIQIQSYSRRYTQSQLSGGGGGGGGGGPQDEISQRQRQIIISTWNLIREQAEGSNNAKNSAQVELNSTLLSQLQTTLAEQAQTLAERTRARQLNQDQDIEKFVANLDLAIQAMYPSSELLATVALEEALQPAQEALQHLLRAEAIFNDITVSQQQGGGGGGGGSASQDLAEMFELEMDLEKNQYETGNSASPQAQQQQEEDIMKQLDELAQRQEQLANNMRNQSQISEAQKYQQEMLRREVEELQEQLERMEQQSQSSQQASNSQQGQGSSGEGGENGESPESGSQTEDQQTNQQSQNGEQVAQQSELQRRIDSALRAMQETADAMNNPTSPEELQRAADEAQRQLQGARDQVAQDQLANMQESFNSMSSQAKDMLREQRRMEQTLQAAAETAISERESGVNPDSRGMSLQAEWDLAKEKQTLAGNIQSLQQQMIDATQRFSEQAPEASREIQQANNSLTESRLEQAVTDAALYIDSGYGLYIVGNESNVTAEMRALSENLERAQQLASGAGARGDSDLDRAQQQAQDLRAQLQEQLAQAQQGSNQAEQASQNDQNSPGQGQQPGEGQANNGSTTGQQIAGGAWNGSDTRQTGPLNLPNNFFNNVDNLTELARSALPQLDLNSEELAEMYDLIRELEYSRVNRTDNIIAQEYNSMLALIEQLEVGLQIDSSSISTNNVRTAISEIIPEEYRESVAEYYRKLSTNN